MTDGLMVILYNIQGSSHNKVQVHTQWKSAPATTRNDTDQLVPMLTEELPAITQANLLSLSVPTSFVGQTTVVRPPSPESVVPSHNATLLSHPTHSTEPTTIRRWRLSRRPEHFKDYVWMLEIKMKKSHLDNFHPKREDWCSIVSFLFTPYYSPLSLP